MDCDEAIKLFKGGKEGIEERNRRRESGEGIPELFEANLRGAYLERAYLGWAYQGDPNVFFPVRLDDYVFSGWSHPRKADVIAKVVADAQAWSKKSVYAKVRDRLIRDLKAE